MLEKFSKLFFLSLLLPPLTSTLFPYTTLFRSKLNRCLLQRKRETHGAEEIVRGFQLEFARRAREFELEPSDRSEEHTSELQSRGHLVCRLLLEKKNINLQRTRLWLL